MDFVFLARPLLLCVSLTFFFAGAARLPTWPAAALSPCAVTAMGPGLLLFALTVAASFAVNQIFDVESDRVNRKNFLIGSGLVSRGEAGVFSAALVLAALLLALGSRAPVRELGLAGIVLGLAYSIPPVRLKGKPVADMLANGLGFGMVGFALGWLGMMPLERSMLVRAAPYTLAMCAIFLNTTIPDEAGDREAGDRTSCVAFGRTRVARAALALLAVAAAGGLLAGEAPCALAASASLPAFIAVALHPTTRESVLASQFAGRAFFVMVAVAVPQLALLGALAYAASRVYYSRRLGLEYPRMEGAIERARMCPRPGEGCKSTPPRSGP